MQAAIRKITHDAPGPDRKYAIQARKHIAAVHRREPRITIEIRRYRHT